jgi:hypothetical protein
MRQKMTMRLAAALLMALAFAPAASRAECQPSDETVRVRISLKPANNLEVAGFVMSVTYPADQLVIPGYGKDAESAVSKTPEGSFTGADDRDGELRLVVAKAKALSLAPVCEITFHRCQGAKKASVEAVTCKLTDASDPSTNKIKTDDVTCLVGAAS